MTTVTEHTPTTQAPHPLANTRERYEGSLDQQLQQLFGVFVRHADPTSKAAAREIFLTHEGIFQNAPYGILSAFETTIRNQDVTVQPIRSGGASEGVTELVRADHGRPASGESIDQLVNEVLQGTAAPAQPASAPSATIQYRQYQTGRLQNLLESFMENANDGEYAALIEMLELRESRIAPSLLTKGELPLLWAFSTFRGYHEDQIFQFQEAQVPAIRAFERYCTDGGDYRAKVIQGMIELLAAQTWLTPFLRTLTHMWREGKYPGIQPALVQDLLDDAKREFNEALADARDMLQQYPELVQPAEVK